MRLYRHYSPRGFTLIELLVGLSIATFIMGSAAVVFVTTMENWERGKREERLLRAAQTTADLIERYLRCAAPPGNTYGGFTGEDLSTEEVDGHRLTLLSTAEGRFPRAALRTDKCEVEFCYDPGMDTSEAGAPEAGAAGMGTSGMGAPGMGAPGMGAAITLRIDATPDDDIASGGLRVQLSPYVQAFRVTYFDGVEWLGDWYENQLPKAVEFHLIIGDPEDLDAEGNMRTREFSRLVWIPMGKERPPEATGELDSSGMSSGSTFDTGGGGR